MEGVWSRRVEYMITVRTRELTLTRKYKLLRETGARGVVLISYITQIHYIKFSYVQSSAITSRFSGGGARSSEAEHAISVPRFNKVRKGAATPNTGWHETKHEGASTYAYHHHHHCCRLQLISQGKKVPKASRDSIEPCMFLQSL